MRSFSMIHLSRSIRRITGRRRFFWSMSLFLLSVALLSSVYIFLGSAENEAAEDDDIIVMLSDTKYQKEYIDKKGIHVIVGQYMGKSFPWEITSNVSDEYANANFYSPLPKAGQNGMPVYVPQQDYQRMKLLFNINRFNLLVSDQISVNRSLPDPRKQPCRDKLYNIPKGFDTSVIIVFHNEAWSTLLRTVHSVINRSQKKNLKEIILVDDASTRKFLGSELDYYAGNISSTSGVKVKVLRSGLRIGLIKARLLGAKEAKGKVLTFLDAHCETTVGWLEPLLSRIAEDPTRVVCPVIDVINEDTFAFAKSFELHWGGINWNLHFRWYPISKEEIDKNKLIENDDGKPFKTPIMAGGLFAIDRNYFYNIGAYDEYMDIWGGENIELSLRIWQCGGRIEIAPCSHVGHLFRKSSPYTFPRKGGVAGVLYRNLARVAEVWLDDWKTFFYKINPVAKRTIFGEKEIGKATDLLTNITERVNLRNNLQCEGFQWFLDNVWPEHFFPTKDRFFGQIKSEATSECMQRPNADGSPSMGNVGKVEMSRCAIEMYAPQCFVYSKQGTIMTDESVCLDVSKSLKRPMVILFACSESKKQKWKYSTSDKTLRHLETGYCLNVDSNRRTLSVKKCAQESSQRWNMVPREWY